jgi:hypothetical protein
LRRCFWDRTLVKKDKSACLLHDYATRSGFIHAPSRAELSHDASHAVEQTLHGILHHQDPISLHVVLDAVTALLVGQIRIPGRSLDPLTQEGTGFGLDGSAVSDAKWEAVSGHPRGETAMGFYNVRPLRNTMGTLRSCRIRATSSQGPSRSTRSSSATSGV